MNVDNPFDLMSGKNYKDLDMSPEMRKVIVNIAILISKSVPVSHLALRGVIIRAILKTQNDTRITFTDAKEKGGVIFKQFYETLSSNLKNLLRPLVNHNNQGATEEVNRSVSEVDDYMNKFKSKGRANLGCIEYETGENGSAETE